MSTLVLDIPVKEKITKIPDVYNTDGYPNAAKPVEQNNTEQNSVEQNDTPQTDDSIGLNIPVMLIGIHDEPTEAKIDTGAASCSLGATEIQCNGDIVQFTIGNKTYRATCHSKQNIQTSEGDEERPVVELTCKIKDDVYPKVLFNINDRSDLKDQVLIGLNLLHKLKTKINPNEETDSTDR